MKKTAHTPGPWACDYEDYNELHISSEDRFEASIVPIATVSTGYEGPIEDEQIANAHLIAAAPEMLEALRAARLCVEGYIDRCNHTKGREVLAMLDAAIARAEGRSDA